MMLQNNGSDVDVTNNSARNTAMASTLTHGSIPLKHENEEGVEEVLEEGVDEAPLEGVEEVLEELTDS